jgi:hypothetical protein
MRSCFSLLVNASFAASLAAEHVVGAVVNQERTGGCTLRMNGWLDAKLFRTLMSAFAAALQGAPTLLSWTAIEKWHSETSRGAIY